MSEALSGKVVLVTGGAKRVGAAIARRLHRQGANLMLHYRGSEREARALRAELNVARTDSVALVQADLLDIAGLSEIVRNTIGRTGSALSIVPSSGIDTWKSDSTSSR